MSRKKPPRAPAVIDACCLIDLLASGRPEEILKAAGFAWHLPVAVQDAVTPGFAWWYQHRLAT